MGSWGSAARGVCRAQLASRQQQDVLLLLMEPQLLPGQPGLIQLPLRGRQLPGKGTWNALLPVHPVQGHLVPDVIVQSTVGIVSQDFLVGTGCRGKLRNGKEQWDRGGP